MRPVIIVVLSFLIQAGTAWADPPQPSEQTIRDAITRSIPLLEKSSLEYTKQRECFSCHHQTLPILALNQASKKALPVNPQAIKSQVDWTAKFLEKNAERFREGKGTGGQADTAGYALWALIEGGYTADCVTEAVAEYLLQRHKDLDHWQVTSKRPPTEASDFTTTFLALQGLMHYAGSAQQERLSQRREQVAKWLANAEASDTEDHVFRLRALAVAKFPQEEIESAADKLVSLQRPDGGWAQLSDMESDAYATASVLAALAQVGGLATTDPVYRRGIQFLLEKQLDDGSWHVTTRSKPIQTYFESGFPHGADQFISISATAWSVVALALALPEPEKP